MTQGDPEMVEFLKKLQQTVHNPKYPDYQLMVGHGSQDLMTKV
jgi:hypothetical protein